MYFLSPAEPCTVSDVPQMLSNEMIFSMFDFVLFHNSLDNLAGGGEGSSTFSCKEEE